MFVLVIENGEELIFGCDLVFLSSGMLSGSPQVLQFRPPITNNQILLAYEIRRFLNFFSKISRKLIKQILGTSNSQPCSLLL